MRFAWTRGTAALRRDPTAMAQLALLVVGELSWLWAWSLVLGRLIGGGRSALVGLPLVAVLLLLGSTARAFVRARVRPPFARPVMLGLGGVVAVLAAEVVWWAGQGPPWRAGWLPAEDGALQLRGVAAGAIALIAWGRGAALPWPRPTFERVESSFRVCGRALVALLVIAAAASGVAAPVLPVVTAAALLALGAGLVGMPLARVLDIRRERDPDGIVPLAVGRQWAGILGGSIAGLLLTAVVLAWALVAGLLARVLGWLAAPSSVLGAAVALVGDLWLRLTAWLYALVGTDRPLPNDVSSLTQPGLRAPPLRQPVMDAGSTGSLDSLLSLLAALAAAALFALLAVVLARASRRLGFRVGEDDVEEERDYVWPSMDDAWRLDLLRLVGARVTRRGRNQRDPLADGPARRVRLLYRRLQRLGMRAGRPRAPAETPRDYQAALGDVPPFGARAADLEAVTALYGAVRYGEDSPSAVAVDAAQRAVRRLATRRP